MDVSRAFKSRSMKSMLGDHLLRNGLPKITSNKTQAMKLLPGGPSDVSCTWRQHKVVSAISTMNKFVRRKLSLGVDNIFREIFSIREEERLLKAFQCKLYTTAGPIAGRLFISTEKVAFCSDRAIAKVSSPTGELHRFHYKVVIPLSKIKRANQSENTKKPSQNYLQVITKDEFDFWFTGFLNYRKTFNCLQQAVVSKLI